MVRMMLRATVVTHLRGLGIINYTDDLCCFSLVLHEAAQREDDAKLETNILRTHEANTQVAQIKRQKSSIRAAGF